MEIFNFLPALIWMIYCTEKIYVKAKEIQSEGLEEDEINALAKFQVGSLFIGSLIWVTIGIALI